MNKILFLSLFVLLGCTSNQVQKQPEILVNEDFYPYYEESNSTITTNYYQLNLNAESDAKLALVQSIHDHLINKQFSSAQIFPQGSLFRNRVHAFTLDTTTTQKNIINAKLIKDERFSSYKLVILKTDPKTKKEANRQWLYPDNLSNEQLSIRVAKAIVRYSFQEL